MMKRDLSLVLATVSGNSRRSIATMVLEMEVGMRAARRLKEVVLVRVAAAAVFTLVAGGFVLPARAAFQQKLCPQSWSDAPVDVGTHEFDRDFRPGIDGVTYGMNQWSSWPVWVSSNVEWMDPHLLNWQTEAGADVLTLNNSYGFSGNLGTQWAGPTSVPESQMPRKHGRQQMAVSRA